MAGMIEQNKTTLTVPDTVDMAYITGPADRYVRLLQEAYQARITVRGNTIELAGDAIEVQALTSLFSDFIQSVEHGHIPDEDYVKRALELIHQAELSPQALREDILLTYRGRAIRPKTAGQKHYVDAIRNNVVTFAIGPAGTGKTYLAMAMAIAALKRREVARIVLTRPIVEAGENLGFLPGTLTEKVDPYIRPLYDALFDMCDFEKAHQLIDTGVIEIAPLAFMRGRTLSESFIILDEAQNTTPEQMKMFLTRLGIGSKMVVTGDISQIDLPGSISGLKQARSILEGIDDITFCYFSGKDVVRHSLVASIVAAYDRYHSGQGSAHDVPSTPTTHTSEASSADTSAPVVSTPQGA